MLKVGGGARGAKLAPVARGADEEVHVLGKVSARGGRGEEGAREVEARVVFLVAEFAAASVESVRKEEVS